MSAALLTTREAAARLGIHPSRVRHLIAEGRLPARKHGRDWLIAEADLGRVQDRPAGWRKGRPRTSAER